MEAYQCHGSNVGPLGTFRKGSGSVTGGVPFLAYNVQAVGAEGTGPHARVADVAKCLDGKGGFCDNQGGTIVAFDYKQSGGDASVDVAPTMRALPHARSHPNGGGHIAVIECPDISPALKARDYKGPSSDGDGDGMPLVAHSLRAEGHDASEDGTGRGVPLVPVAFEHRGVRRLMPIEAERLQGFSDGYTRIPWRGRSAEECPDGPRYKALGNSMAVPVMAWIGRRIALVDSEPR